MKKDLTKDFEEEDLESLAKQLNKPQGELGIKVGVGMNEGNKVMNLHTIAILDPQPYDNILEIGMANGHFVKNIVSLDNTIQYTGCDYSQDMVDEATKANQLFVELEQSKFICADISSLPFEDKSFNKVFTINTIYFWENVVSILRELFRVLKSGGELIIALRPASNMKSFPVTQHNFTLYSREDVESLLKTNGFSEIEVTHIYEPLTLAWGNEVIKEALIVQCYIP